MRIKKLFLVLTLSLLMGIVSFIPVQATAQYVSPSPQSTPQTNAANQSFTVESPYPVPNAPTVIIKNFQFQPNEIDVTVGQTVTWTNLDGTAHTTTSPTSNADSWDSGTIFPGQSYTRTFNIPGVFQYHCNFHPNMIGIIRVSERVKPTTQNAYSTHPSQTYVPPSNTSQSYPQAETPTYKAITNPTPYTYPGPRPIPYKTVLPSAQQTKYTRQIQSPSQYQTIIIFVQNSGRIVKQMITRPMAQY